MDGIRRLQSKARPKRYSAADNLLGNRHHSAFGRVKQEFVCPHKRTITIARELTKIFETIHVCRLGEAAQWLGADTNRVKGEFVLLVEGAPVQGVAAGAEAPRVLDVLLRELPLSQAVRLAADITGAKKNELYDTALVSKRSPKIWPCFWTSPVWQPSAATLRC